jgi:hypothetical protein
MKRQFLSICAILVAAGSVPAAGCKDDPPPPPTPDTASASASSRSTPDRKMVRLSPEAMKAYRVETCYYGALGLRRARDAYLASVGNAEPSADKIPSFGEYPDVRKFAGDGEKGDKGDKKEQKDKTEPAVAASGSATPAPKTSGSAAGVPPGGSAMGHGGMQGRPGMTPTRQLPFVRHLRSCSVAKTLKTPAYEGFDGKLEEFEKYSTKLNQTLLEAQRYYTRKQYEKDEFKRGKELHKTLTDEFGKLDEQLKAFDGAIRGWYDKLKPPPDELDEGGKMASEAVGEARKLTLALLAGEANAEKAKDPLEKVKKTITTLEDRHEKDKREAHAAIVTPKLKAWVGVIEHVLKDGDKLSDESNYLVSAAMAELVEADQRAVAQLLRGKGGGGSGMRGPMRLNKPGLRQPGMEQLPSKPRQSEDSEQSSEGSQE